MANRSQAGTNDALPGAPKAPAKPKKTEQLHIAYQPGEKPPAPEAFVDAVVFGTRPEALEYAIAHTGWQVITTVKGKSLADAIAEAS